MSRQLHPTETPPLHRGAHLSFILAAAISMAGMWTYADRVMVFYQIRDAAAHGHPRGNLSDLYPRWLGARELLLHGRDPYSRDVTREIQAGYYGRPIDPSRPQDPKDEQGFAYPVYVAFLLRPLVHLPFPLAQRIFFCLLIVLTAASIWLWLRFLRISISLPAKMAILGLTFGSFAVMQGMKLQQMTLLVSGLISVSLTLLVAGFPKLAGVFLALATIKPQLIFLLVIWLALWAVSDLRRRFPFAVSFIVTMLILVAGSELLLPHWLPRFWHALAEYRRYTGSVSALDELMPWHIGRIFEVAAVLATAWLCWRNRQPAQDSLPFAATTCLVLAITIFIVPSYAPYNQVLLLPAFVLLAWDRRALMHSSAARRLLWMIVLALVVWPWISSTLLAAMSFFVPEHVVLSLWSAPGWTTLLIPIGVAALMLLYTHRMPPTAPERPPA